MGPAMNLDGERSFDTSAEAQRFADSLPPRSALAYVVVWRHSCAAEPSCDVCGCGYSHDVPSDGGPLAGAAGHRSPEDEQRITGAARSAVVFQQLREIVQRHADEVPEGTPPHQMAWHKRHAQAHRDRGALLALLRELRDHSLCSSRGICSEGCPYLALGELP